MIKRFLSGLTQKTSPSANLTQRWSAVEPLEERVLFALSASSGGSGYSGTLSKNTAIRKQQLICDPIEPLQGSTSVRYDPACVHLSGAVPGPGYDNQYFTGFVEVKVTRRPDRDDDDRDRRGCTPTTRTFLQSLKSFFRRPLGIETGYAQIQYRLTGSAGQLAPPAGYDVAEEGGVTGVDTHAFFFDLCEGVTTLTNVPYTVFAANPNAFSGNTEDFLLTNEPVPTRIGPANLTPANVSSDSAPTITSVGGPYTISEGAGLTLSASATDLETPDTLTYAWDLNGDNTTDATGPSPTFSAAQLDALGLADGPKAATIKLSVSDGIKTTTATAPLTVTNVAPAATGGAVDGSLLAPAKFNLAATDPSLADTAAGFSYQINWGDGTPVQTVAASANNGIGVAVTHQYTRLGSYAASAVAIDKDGGASSAVSATIAVSGAQLLPDPAKPSKLALFVHGTAGADTIRFSKCSTGVIVTMNGVAQGTFRGYDRTIVRGFAGNDDIRISFPAGSEVAFFGGTGDDSLFANTCNAILNGGDGNDTLCSDGGRDLLIGGYGADKLNGGGGDDILLGGASLFDSGTDSNICDLTAAFCEWTSYRSYSARVSTISAMAAGTVFDDGVTDLLTGAGGCDWFLAKRTGTGPLDTLDAVRGETVTYL